MRIAFDVTPLSVPRSGIGNYLRGVLSGLAASAGSEHEVLAFGLTGRRGRAAVEESLDGLGVQTRLLSLPLENVWRRCWSWLGRPGVERLLGPVDVLHLSDWWQPPQRGGLRSATIYDLVPLHFPEWVTARTLLGHRLTYRHVAGSCDLVFAISEFTKADVLTTLGIAEERIHVAHPGVDTRFSPDGPRADLGAPYVLTVATLEPRKNLQTLLAAHALRGGDHLLAVAGARGWGKQEGREQRGVRWLGYVSDDELPALCRGAAAFVFPSRFEGFGMPIVEAMASGVPVVASAHPSMDEASGDAAVRADPDSAEAFAEAIERALGERETLAPRGLEHARRFSWAHTSRVFLEAFTGRN